MKKLLAFLGVLALTGAGCASSQPVSPAPLAPAPEPVQPSAPAPTPTPVSPLPTPASVDVTIQNFAYSPSSITVKKGTKVTFTNQDSVAHTVTGDTGTELDSPMIAKGQSYIVDTNTLDPGTYRFHCKPHPTMKGTLVVE